MTPLSKKSSETSPCTTQLVLDILPLPSYGASYFIESPANSEAFSAVMSWPKWSFPILSLYGPKRCGKTYLSHLWKTRSEASFITLQDCETLLTTDLRTHHFSNFILEDLTILPQHETLLFNFHNWVLEQKGHLLITSLHPLAHASYTLNDLKSRFKSLHAVEIKRPDEDLLLKVMRRYFEEAHLYLDETLLEYALFRLERSFESVLTFCEILNKTALSSHRKVTLPLLKEVLIKMTPQAL